MRRLKTLNRDAHARSEVAKASKQCQSGDMLDFGLLCYERGRLVEHDPRAAAVVRAAVAVGRQWESRGFVTNATVALLVKTVARLRAKR